MTDEEITQGSVVKKTGGNYTLEGVVVCKFSKLSDAIRVVVEDDRGCLYIFSPKQLERK